MALTFSVVYTATTTLWDFGWFDLTRFKVDGPPSERQDARRVLAEFLRDQISQRAFCNQGHWGDPVKHHGPFSHHALVAEWFRPLTGEQFSELIQVVLNSPEFMEPPNSEQREPLESWSASVRARGDDVFALDVPDQTEIKVDWDQVWVVYQEFATVSREGEELSIGVIGYD